MNEVEWDMKNYADQGLGGCYRPRWPHPPRSTKFFISYESRIYQLLYYSFKITPSLKTSSNMLTFVDVNKYTSIVHV